MFYLKKISWICLAAPPFVFKYMFICLLVSILGLKKWDREVKSHQLVSGKARI